MDTTMWIIMKTGSRNEGFLRTLGIFYYKDENGNCWGIRKLVY